MVILNSDLSYLNLKVYFILIELHTSRVFSRFFRPKIHEFVNLWRTVTGLLNLINLLVLCCTTAVFYARIENFRVENCK